MATATKHSSRDRARQYDHEIVTREASMRNNRRVEARTRSPANVGDRICSTKVMAWSCED